MDDENSNHDNVEIPWQTGVFDAHCHPTDTMASIDHISTMKAKVLTIMATRKEDQNLVGKVAEQFSLKEQDEYHRSSSTHVVPAFGWHPWFSHLLFDDRLAQEKPDATAHYRDILTPAFKDEAFLTALPKPESLTDFLAETEARLRKHPFALVGEVGLDKSFRLPQVRMPNEVVSRDNSITPGSREGRTLSSYRVSLSHQKVILEAQLRLAAKLERPVSIHSVHTHGAVHEILQKLWSGHEKASGRERRRRLSAVGAHAAEEDENGSHRSSSSPLPFPPRICMHSYSGTADFVREFLKNTVPIDVYFSFSETVNFSAPQSERATGVIRSVPDSKILIESDLHSAGPDMDDRLGSVFQRVCKIRNWSFEEGVQILSRNWRCFVFGA